MACFRLEWGDTERIKDVTGPTYEEMLKRFDARILGILSSLSTPYSDLIDNSFCAELRAPGALEARRSNALTIISLELERVYHMPVVVLIDEYDTPMHSAIENNYSGLVRLFILFNRNCLMLFQANGFFSAVFGVLVEGLSRSTPETPSTNIFLTEQRRGACQYDGGYMQDGIFWLVVVVEPSQGENAVNCRYLDI